MTTDPPTSTEKNRQKARDPFFDNAKYLAVVLVAAGHSWEPLLGGSRSTAALYMFVYTFHMPAFVLIAGYFSRHFTGRPDQLRRLITGLGVPYLVFEVLYIAFHRKVTGGDHPFSLLDPYYVTWFLIALFIWRLTSPLWRVVRWPVPVAVLIAVAASVQPHLGDDFNIARVFQFLPFFVLGLRLGPEHFARLRTPGVRAAAAVAAPAGLAVAYWAAPRYTNRWFYRTYSAQELGYEWWAGALMTPALTAAGLLLTAAFLAWVPSRRTWFTALGVGTVYGYLLHGFLAKFSRWRDWYAAEWVQGPAGPVAVTLIAAAVMTLLCTAPVRRTFRALVEPSMDWAFRTGPAAAPAAEPAGPAESAEPAGPAPRAAGGRR
ncbi:acyltransferase family protein [Streptomyces aidingensis]|uniref:Fucose 4-O-acetylase n=1 Tax=Streptomyces aidingensis TaxID=910347 RepID=A0A1I1FLW5_9ACTN|nr:acyltransferase family protein [Streptomyces aidingensis]SFB98648.1 Fucose 4-O-acetylase [Streptomyces aidingensis]